MRERAAEAAVRRLARTDVSRWELTRLLLRQGFDEAAAEAETAELARQGLLDDRRFAATLVATTFRRKGLGRAGMRRELRRRHLPDDVIADTLAGIDDDADRERARHVAAARAGHLHGLDAATAERRLAGYLQRRGFGADVIAAVLQEVLADTAARGGGDPDVDGTGAGRFDPDEPSE